LLIAAFSSSIITLRNVIQSIVPPQFLLGHLMQIGV
jgi:hypothetical protein